MSRFSDHVDFVTHSPVRNGLVELAKWKFNEIQKKASVCSLSGIYPFIHSLLSIHAIVSKKRRTSGFSHRTDSFHVLLFTRTLHCHTVWVPSTTICQRHPTVTWKSHLIQTTQVSLIWNLHSYHSHPDFYTVMDWP